MRQRFSIEPIPCMTDRLAALSTLVSSADVPEDDKQEQLQKFYDQANGDALVLNKWFAIQVRNLIVTGTNACINSFEILRTVHVCTYVLLVRLVQILPIN